MTIRPSSFFCGVLLLGAALTSSFAVADEQRARAVLDYFISSIDAGMQSDAGKLVLNRDYELAETNGVYSANFQEAAVTVGDGDTRVDFGPMIIELEPIADKRVNISFKFTDTVEVRQGNEVQARISIGAQSITGVWSEPINYYVAGDARLENIQVKIMDEPASITITSLAGVQALNVDANDNWQQEQTFTLNNIDAKFENSNGFTLAKLDGEITAAGSNYSQLMNISADMQAVAAKLEKDDQQAPMELAKLSQVFGNFGAYTFKMQGDDLAMLSGSTPMASIKRISMGSSLDTAKSDGSAIDFYFDLDGFDSMLAPLPPNLLPRQARFQMVLNKIPEGMMNRIMEVSLASVDVSKAERDALFQQEMLGFIMGSEMEFRLIDTFVAAEDTRADLNLRSAVAPQSLMGGVGEMLLRIEGMQTLIDMTGVTQNPSVAPALTMITAFSDRTEEDGKTVDTFDLKFTPDAKLMLNGKDISAMVMPGMQ